MPPPKRDIISRKLASDSPAHESGKNYLVPAEDFRQGREANLSGLWRLAQLRVPPQELSLRRCRWGLLHPKTPRSTSTAIGVPFGKTSDAPFWHPPSY